MPGEVAVPALGLRDRDLRVRPSFMCDTSDGDASVSDGRPLRRAVQSPSTNPESAFSKASGLSSMTEWPARAIDLEPGRSSDPRRPSCRRRPRRARRRRRRAPPARGRAASRARPRGASPPAPTSARASSSDTPAPRLHEAGVEAQLVAAVGALRVQCTASFAQDLGLGRRVLARAARARSPRRLANDGSCCCTSRLIRVVPRASSSGAESTITRPASFSGKQAREAHRDTPAERVADEHHARGAE